MDNSPIQNVEITLINAQNGLVGFCSFQYHGMQLNGISLRNTSEGKFRLLYPTKKLRNNPEFKIYYPIGNELNGTILKEVMKKYREIMEKM